MIKPHTSKQDPVQSIKYFFGESGLKAVRMAQDGATSDKIRQSFGTSGLRAVRFYRKLMAQ